MISQSIKAGSQVDSGTVLELTISLYAAATNSREYLQGLPGFERMG
ncbi:MAG: hypothetical protein ACLVJ6_07180 [Merdibacter sp.]